MQQVTHETWLWNEIRYNNEQALYQLYMESYDRLFQYGLRASPDAEIVKSTINEVFTGLWLKRGRLVEVENVSGYVFIYFKRVLFHQLQKSKGRRWRTGDINPDKELSEMPYEELLIAMEEDKEVKQLIKTAVDQLTKRQKELIGLRFYEEMSYEDIADKTGLTLRTIYNTLHTAITLLRKALGRG